MRQIFFLVLLFITTGLFAQAPANYTNINGRYRWIAGMFDSTFHIPKGTTTSLRTGGSTNAGALFYRTTDSSVYYYTGTQWLRVAGAAGFVPYTGATQNVNLGQFGLTTKFIQFDTSSQAVTDRRLQWSNAEGTLQFGMTNGATITQRVGLEQFARVRNLQGDTIEAGDVVYISGASGDRAAVKLADNRADSTSSKTLGVATEQILPNDVGLVGTFGVVGKLNLSAFTAGDVVYLDSIPGKLTKVKPQAPYHMVFVGVVERANAGNGLLFVNVQNGYELDELHNVRITSPVPNRAILTYDSVRSLWVDTTLNAIGGITGTGTSGQVAYFNGTNSITSSPTFAFTPTSQLLVNNSVTASGAIARGINATPSLTAAANNDVLVGLDINPTFTNGAFTGVINYGLRVGGSTGLVYDQTNSRLGIGIVQPLGKIDANGSIILRGTGFALPNAPTLFLSNTTTTTGRNYGLNSNNTGEFSIFDVTAGNATRFQLFSNGNIVIGSSADAGFRLDIGGTARVQSFTTINAAPAVNSDAALSVNATTNNSTSGQMYGIRSVSTVATNTGNLTGIDATINNSTTAQNMAGFNSAVNVSANTTAQVRGYSVGGAVTGSGVVSTYVGYDYVDVFKSGSGAVTRQNAIRIANLTAGSAANIGILFNNAGASTVNGTWDIYSQSGNASYLAGNLLLGTTSDIGGRLQVAGTITATSAIARGVNFTNTLVAAANNDVLVGLDINPTFTNGAFTGVSNWSARFQSADVQINGLNFGKGAGSGTSNVAIGTRFSSVYVANNSTGVGVGSLDVTTGGNNAAFGYAALLRNTTGTFNVGIGGVALQNNTTGGTNIALGYNAGSVNTTGSNNIFIGNWTTGVVNSNSNWTYIGNSTTTSTFIAGNLLLNTTTDAGFRLDVNGTARVSGNLTANSFEPTSGTLPANGIYLSAANTVAISTNSGNRLTITSGSLNTNTVISSTAINTSQTLNGTHNTFTHIAGNTGTTLQLSSTGVATSLGISNSTTASTANSNFALINGSVTYNHVGSSGLGSGIILNVTSGTTTTGANNTLWGGQINATSNFAGTTAIGLQLAAVSTSGTARALQTTTGDVVFGSTSGNVMIGTTTAGGRFTIQPTNNQVGMAISGSSLTGSNAQSLLSLSQTWNTTGNPTAIKLDVTNTASGNNSYLLDLQVGGIPQFTVFKGGEIKTSSPAGGVAQTWKLGSVHAVTPTSPDRTIEVEVNGTTYYLHAKTTNN